jgi:hypothetical protein
MSTTYYWVTFAVSLACLLYIPSKRCSSADNFGGAVVLSLFGCFLWPFFVFAAIKFAVKGDSE